VGEYESQKEEELLDFEGNGVAIDASSNWSTLTADPADCAYVPTMEATGNRFGGSSDPLVSVSD
jgi:hypothetical protein